MQRGAVCEIHPVRQSACRHISAAENQPEKRRAVPCVKTVDGKGGAPPLTVSAAAHTVRRCNGVFQRPCDNNGEDLQRRPEPPVQWAGGYVPADAALRLRNRAELRLKPRNKAQGHTEHERKRGDHPAKQVDKFIGGHNRVVAVKPHQHGPQHHSRRKAVQDAFQRQRISGRKICQNRRALMAESRIEHCR